MAKTTFTRQAEGYLTFLYEKEKSAFNSLDKFEVHNGSHLTIDGVKSLFDSIHKLMVESKSFIFNEEGIFKNLYENHSFYDAFSFLLSIIDHLSALNITTWEDLPIGVTVAIYYHTIDKKSLITTVEKGVVEGFYVVYFFCGSVACATTKINGLKNGIFDYYNGNGELSHTSIYFEEKRLNK